MDEQAIKKLTEKIEQLESRVEQLYKLLETVSQIYLRPDKMIFYIKN